MADRTRIAVVHSAPSGRAGRHWGDTHFAASLAAALARTGADPLVVARDEREAAAGMATIVVRGLYEHRPSADAPSVLWVISHSDDVSDEELAAFDHVCVASSSEAARFDARTTTPVHVLHQATDLARFRPPGVRPVTAGAGTVVVANNRWPGRRAPRWLHQLGLPYSLYGAKWGGTPEERYLAATGVPNEHLAGLYATVDVVVADQWTQMARDGFVANRVFDVAASGGFVLSDDGPGVREVFDDLVATYDSRASLGAQLAHWLADPAGRRRLSAQAMQRVRNEHGFDHRARRLMALLDG